MTPQERRQRHPLPPVEPMTDEAVRGLEMRAEHWLTAPDFASRSLDLSYHTQACLIATIRKLQGKRSDV